MSESHMPNSENSGAERDWLGMARSARAALNLSSVDSDEDLIRELLVIGLDSSPYAIAVERVREIVRMRTLTSIPRAPAWLLGVVALRGEVLEVIDLRRRLGITPSQPTRSNRIIVLHGDGDRVTAVLVDSVSTVHRVREDEIGPVDALGLSAVVEMCQLGSEFVSILDIDRVLGLADG